MDVPLYHNDATEPRLSVEEKRGTGVRNRLAVTLYVHERLIIKRRKVCILWWLLIDSAVIDLGKSESHQVLNNR